MNRNYHEGNVEGNVEGDVEGDVEGNVQGDVRMANLLIYRVLRIKE